MSFKEWMKAVKGHSSLSQQTECEYTLKHEKVGHPDWVWVTCGIFSLRISFQADTDYLIVSVFDKGKENEDPIDQMVMVPAELVQ